MRELTRRKKGENLVETERNTPAETKDLGYMEELSKAYREAFAKRLSARRKELSEEARGAIMRMQADLSRIAGKLALSFRAEEKKELARMIKESAEETLRALVYDEEERFAADPADPLPPAVLFSRAVILANRCLNLILRHKECDERLFQLILSEISALYAIAAIN